MGFWRNQLSGPTDPAIDAGWEDPPANEPDLEIHGTPGSAS